MSNGHELVETNQDAIRILELVLKQIRAYINDTMPNNEYFGMVQLMAIDHVISYLKEDGVKQENKPIAETQALTFVELWNRPTLEAKIVQGEYNKVILAGPSFKGDGVWYTITFFGESHRVIYKEDEPINAPVIENVIREVYRRVGKKGTVVG